jgi:hypothetical protein
MKSSRWERVGREEEGGGGRRREKRDDKVEGRRRLNLESVIRNGGGGMENMTEGEKGNIVWREE